MNKREMLEELQWSERAAVEHLGVVLVDLELMVTVRGDEKV
jgi:hypothetical protein